MERFLKRNDFINEGTELITLNDTFNTTNCTLPSSQDFPDDFFTKEERLNGWICIHFFASFYTIYALLLVCEEYLIPAIQCIREELRIPHSIAGATIMAVSTSCPELFTNIMGTFVTKGDLGVGATVGSAMFNLFACGAAIGIGAYLSGKPSEKKSVPLEWWGLSRDSAFFILSVILLVGILRDGKVFWPEALVMLALYGFYIAGMWFDEECKDLAELCIYQMKSCFGKSFSEEVNRKSQLPKEREEIKMDEIKKDLRHPDEKCKDREEHFCTVTLSRSNSEEAQKIETPDQAESSKVISILKKISAFPIKLALSWTIPNCKEDSNRKWSWLSVFCCIAWIGSLSYVITWMVCIISETFEIPESVSGLTFLAAGTSLPEVISSVIVARQGLGSMALSNSIGANIFDILMGLGIPWLIEASILTGTEPNYIEIHSGGLQYSALALIGFFALLFLLISWNGYGLDWRIGSVCILLYLVFVTFACLLELNVFFQVNLPPCE